MMKGRKLIGSIFLTIGLVLAVVFYSKIEFPSDFQSYFRIGTYGQFGPMIISIELMIAGYYLFVGHSKTNFALPLFAFTALLDPIFNLAGIFTSIVPLYATIVFVICALLSLWIAFSNKFDTGRISFITALGSFLLGAAAELFFNSL